LAQLKKQRGCIQKARAGLHTPGIDEAANKRQKSAEASRSIAADGHCFASLQATMSSVLGAAARWYAPGYCIDTT